MHAMQIVLICFSAFAVSRVLIRFRRGGMRMLHLGLWLLFWAALIVVALLPTTTDRLARLLGVGRGIDTAIYLSLLLIFYLLFRSFAKIEDMDRQLTRIVRANALREMEKALAEQGSTGEPPAGPTQAGQR
jgi:small membrane protein